MRKETLIQYSVLPATSSIKGRSVVKHTKARLPKAQERGRPSCSVREMLIG